jgi:hypothetical protein
MTVTVLTDITSAATSYPATDRNQSSLGSPYLSYKMANKSMSNILKIVTIIIPVLNVWFSC